MRATSFAVVLGLALTSIEGVNATWREMKPFFPPTNIVNQCTEDQNKGFDWSDLAEGAFEQYKGFNFKGWQCSSQKGKRDLKERTFGRFSKAISCNVGQEQFSNEISADQGFSIGQFHVSVDDFEAPLEFHFGGFADGSSCVKKSKCGPGGNTIVNDQCGGAKTVKIKIPQGASKKKCNLNIHTISFECNTKTFSMPPLPTLPSLPSIALPPIPVPTLPSGECGKLPKACKENPLGPGCIMPPGCPGAGGEISMPPVPILTGIIPGIPSETAPAGSVELPPVPIITAPIPSVTAPGECTGGSECPPSVPSIPGKPEVPGRPEITKPSGPEESVTPPQPEKPGKPESSQAPELPSGSKDSSIPSVPSATVPSIPEVSPPTYGSPDSTSIKEIPSVPSATAPSVPEVSSPTYGGPELTSIKGVPKPSIPAVPAPAIPSLPATNCPSTLPKCLNTWLFKTKCTSNADSSCFCPDKNFVEKVTECLSAWGTNQDEIQKTTQYFVSLCSKYIDQNPAIISAIPPAASYSAPSGVPVQTIVRTYVPLVQDVTVTDVNTVTQTIVIPDVSLVTGTSDVQLAYPTPTPEDVVGSQVPEVPAGSTDVYAQPTTLATQASSAVIGEIQTSTNNFTTPVQSQPALFEGSGAVLKSGVYSVIVAVVMAVLLM